MAGEEWPGQLLSFVRRTRPPMPTAVNAWRDVKVGTVLQQRHVMFSIISDFVPLSGMAPALLLQ